MVYVLGGSVFCWESTSLRKGKNGVQISLLSNRLQTYRGRVYLRELFADRTEPMIRKLDAFRKEVKGRKYEKRLWELIAAAMPFRTKGKLNTIFCSELIAEAYKRMGLLRTKKPSNEYTPNDFAKMRMLKDASLADVKRLQL
jgi:hypothetical protein